MLKQPTPQDRNSTFWKPSLWSPCILLLHLHVELLLLVAESALLTHLLVDVAQSCYFSTSRVLLFPQCPFHDLQLMPDCIPQAPAIVDELRGPAFM